MTQQATKLPVIIFFEISLFEKNKQANKRTTKGRHVRSLRTFHETLEFQLGF